MGDDPPRKRARTEPSSVADDDGNVGTHDNRHPRRSLQNAPPLDAHRIGDTQPTRTTQGPRRARVEDVHDDELDEDRAAPLRRSSRNAPPPPPPDTNDSEDTEPTTTTQASRRARVEDVDDDELDEGRPAQHYQARDEEPHRPTADLRGKCPLCFGGGRPELKHTGYVRVAVKCASS